MFTLPYDLVELDSEKQFPCYYDRPDTFKNSEVQCFCAADTQRSSRKLNGQAVKLIKCNYCDKLTNHVQASTLR